MQQRLKSLFGAQDLTIGSPMRKLIRFSLPLLLGNMAQQMYSTVDAIVVGRYVGDGGLAAIGATMPVIQMLLILFMAISTGASVLVSQNFGARAYERLNRVISNAIVLIIASSLLIMAIAIPLAGPLMRLVRTPENILAMSTSYMQILFIGLLGSAFYNIISGILRGLGDSLTPLLILLLTTFMNTVLDLYFVAVLHWGVEGAAWATILSQAVSATLCLYQLSRVRGIPRLRLANLRPDFHEIANLLRIGLPAGLTQAIFSLAMITVQALTNSMGSTVVAANTAVIRIDGFAMMPNFTLGMAVMTFVGQNLGAGRMDRVDQGTKAAVRLGLTMSTTLTLLVLLFGPQLLHVFTETRTVIDLGTGMMRILAVGYIMMSLNQVFGSVMRGAGDTMPALWISIITTVIIRVPTAYTLAHLTRSTDWPNGHPFSLSVSLLVSWSLGALIQYLVYRRGRWRTLSLVRPQLQVEDAKAVPATVEIDAGL
ncbi:MAG: MATE family efflux transporter [Bacillota bacterium]|nr:MATE family efflux transporter [Bacillota bacterium]